MGKIDEVDIFRRHIEPYIAEMQRALQSMSKEDWEPKVQKEREQLEEAIRQLEALMGGK